MLPLAAAITLDATVILIFFAELTALLTLFPLSALAEAGSAHGLSFRPVINVLLFCARELVVPAHPTILAHGAVLAALLVFYARLRVTLRQARGVRLKVALVAHHHFLQSPVHAIGR